MIQNRKLYKNNKNIFKYSNIFKNNSKKKKKRKSNIKYLYYNRKLKTGLFLKKPVFKELAYPFLFNFKLISQFLNKK